MFDGKILLLYTHSEIFVCCGQREARSSISASGAQRALRPDLARKRKIGHRRINKDGEVTYKKVQLCLCHHHIRPSIIAKLLLYLGNMSVVRHDTVYCPEEA